MPSQQPLPAPPQPAPPQQQLLQQSAEQQQPLLLHDDLPDSGLQLSQNKRKEKARVAARARRSQEAGLIMDIASELNIGQDKLRRIDKSTLVKLAIDYIRAHDVLCICNTRWAPPSARLASLQAAGSPGQDSVIYTSSVGAGRENGPADNDHHHHQLQLIQQQQQQQQPLENSEPNTQQMPLRNSNCFNQLQLTQAHDSTCNSSALSRPMPAGLSLVEGQLKHPQAGPLGKLFERHSGPTLSSITPRAQLHQLQHPQLPNYHHQQQQQTPPHKRSHLQPDRDQQQVQQQVLATGQAHLAACSHASQPLVGPRLSTRSIFAPKTADMNAHFLMVDELADGKAALVLKPDSDVLQHEDLTHLAPSAGERISLECSFL